MTPKRSLSPVDTDVSPDPKRVRVDEQDDTTPTPLEKVDGNDIIGLIAGSGACAVPRTTPTPHSEARTGIQRSIAMVLAHDGFNSATPEAMESFTQLVETYMENMISEVQTLALAARRDHPIPPDFQLMLRRHNIPISSLKPHLNPPVPKSLLNPSYVDALPIDPEAFTALPLLSEELSGRADKDAKIYIPSAFPDFPSKHTYCFTPQEDTSTHDPQAIREQAARTAQEGEDALRRLVRASKMRKQKEVKSLVEQDSHGKERFRLWEQTMKRFMGSENKEHMDQVDVADHSMIVNGEAAMFHRKEVSRLGKRMAPPAASRAI